MYQAPVSRQISFVNAMIRCVIPLSLFLFCQVSLADTCPSVSDIKHHAQNNWRAYDSDTDLPLTPKRITLFKTKIDQFILAEWVEEKDKAAKGGMIHCYYRDNDGSTLDAYLSKDDFIPKNAKKAWYQVSGAMQCAAGKMHLCEFEHSPLDENQLAKK